MEIKKAYRFESNASSRTGTYTEPTICPICKHAIKPHEINYHVYRDDDNHWFLSIFYLCTHCYQPFFVLHKCTLMGTSGYTSDLLHIEPNRYVEEQFEPGINTLSPQFVKIYNQALAAESTGLDEIAGLGYRKAMEFLVKDFCIHLDPDDGERIKALPLSKCITGYIKNDQIQTLATRAAWIGNDEAHYIRKQEGRDIADMKQFIKAIVYFVGMSLIVEDAASMDPA